MMPNRKTDTNNRWGFSTNKIGINYRYPDGSYDEREAIIREQEHYQKGLMWTLANHPRVPADVREEVSRWGLAADEFTDKRQLAVPDLCKGGQADDRRICDDRA
jgi:hypothetical protein